MIYATGEDVQIGDVVCREKNYDSSPMVNHDGSPVPHDGRTTTTVARIVSSTCVQTNSQLVNGDIPTYLVSTLRLIRRKPV